MRSKLREEFYQWLFKSKLQLKRKFLQWVLLIVITPYATRFFSTQFTSWYLKSLKTSSLLFLMEHCDTTQKLHFNPFCVNVYSFNPFSVNPTKWSNTLKQFVGNSGRIVLSVLDYFVGLALKELNALKKMETLEQNELPNFSFSCFSW